MTRVALAVVLVVTLGCRRRHVEPTYAGETPPAAAPTVEASGAAEAPSAAPAAAAPATRPTLPDGGTLNGDPRGPRPAEWKRVVDDAMPELQRCFDEAGLPPGEIPVQMHYTVEPRGETGAVTANASAPQAAIDCCVRVVEGLKFPPYGGPKVERDLGFTWFKRAPGAPVDGGAAPKPKAP